MSGEKSQRPDIPQRLESKKYSFLVEGSMPVLEFEVASGKEGEIQQGSKSHLRLEIYNPLSGEVFEAKFPRGRIEVDADGSITYFSTSSESVNVSLSWDTAFSSSLHKDGGLTLKSPSKIVPVSEKTVRYSKKHRQGSFGNPQFQVRIAAGEIHSQHSYCNPSLQSRAPTGRKSSS